MAINDVRPGYKQTDVGVIPEEWEVKPLGSVGHWFSGGTPSMANDLYWNGEIPWVSAKDMKVSRLRDSLLHVTEKAIGNGTRIAQTDAVLIVVRGMILAHTLPVAVATRPVAFNQDMKALVTSAGIDSEFILAWLQANAQSVLDIASESTHGTKRLASDDLFSMKVGLPPLPEQRAIAEALSDVDALLGALDRLIAKKRDLKQAAMQQLLTGQTRLPGFPGEWEVKRLATICAMKSGEGITDANIDEFSKYPCYGGNGLRGFTSRFTHNGVYALVGRQGALCGNVLGVEGAFFASEHAIVVAAFPHADIRWLTYVLGKMHLNQYSESSAQPGLSVANLLNLAVEAPSTRDEQSAIAEVLSDMDAELAALEQRRDKTRALKQGMMQELLTGRTRLV